MVLDYRERKTVSKNRPKSKPIGLLACAFLLVALISFALGVLVDRFLLPPRDVQMEAPSTPLRNADTPKAPSAQAQPGEGNPPVVSTPPRPAGEPSLTFYETLPKGGKAILGSGINLRKDEAPPKSPAVPPAAKEQGGGAQKPTPNPPEARGGEARRNDEPSPAVGASAKNTAPEAMAQPSQPASAAKETYSVQVASSKERKDADAIRTKLAEKGYSAYVTESTISGKGTWYRVRVGRKLDQSAASNLAEMLGKGAILVPE
ncbi:SPOR domain-containing protein [Geobacter anodireducens]